MVTCMPQLTGRALLLACRCLQGAVLTLLCAMRALTTSQHAAPGTGLTSSVALATMVKLLGVAKELGRQLPWAARSQRQELTHLICWEWTAVWDLWVSHRFWPGGGGGTLGATAAAAECAMCMHVCAQFMPHAVRAATYLAWR